MAAVIAVVLAAVVFVVVAASVAAEAAVAEVTDSRWTVRINTVKKNKKSKPFPSGFGFLFFLSLRIRMVYLNDCEIRGVHFLNFLFDHGYQLVIRNREAVRYQNVKDNIGMSGPFYHSEIMEM